MPTHTEKLMGGLNNAAHPAMLAEGELSLCYNAIYRYNSDLLFHAPVFAELGSVTSSSPAVNSTTGMVPLTFDDGSRKLFITSYNDTTEKVWTAAVDSTTFANLSITPVDVTSSVSSFLGASFTQSLNVAQYANKYYVFNGRGSRNLVVKQDGTLRYHGLVPVNYKPALATASGTWPLGASGVPLWYEYWTTECVISGGVLEIESDATAPDAVEQVYVSTAATQVTITKGAFSGSSDGWANSSATHWRVYRGVGKTTRNESAFPNGVLIAQLPKTDAAGAPVTTFIDGAASSVGPTLPTSAATTTVSGAFSFSTAEMLDDDSVYGTISTTNVGINAGYVTFTFGAGAFTGIADPVAGIEVTVRTYSAAGTGGPAIQAWVELSGDNGVTWKAKKTLVWNSAAPASPNTYGGTGDLWGTSWAASEFSASNFKARIYFRSVLASGTHTLNVDAFKVKFYFNGTNDTGVANTPFPAVYIEVNEVNASCGENGLPPVATAATIFDDCLVTNDVAVRGRLRYSVPGKPESFPSQYYIDFETPDNDEITMLWSLGSRMVVALRHSLWRVSYLPTETDVSFTRGPAFALIDPNFGCVGPMAAAEYTTPDGRIELAFVSAKGLRTTDGFTSRFICSNYDWQSTFAASGVLDATRASQLITNPDNQELILLMPTIGTFTIPGENVTRFANTMLHFAFAPVHVTNDGDLKISGPIVSSTEENATSGNYSYVSAMAVIRSRELVDGLASLVIVGTGGGKFGLQGATNQNKIYWYAPYTSIATNVTNGFSTDNAVVRTRQLFLAGYSGEWRIKEVYTGPTMQDDCTLNLYATVHDIAPPTSPTDTRTITGSGAIAPKVVFDWRAQAHQLEIKTTNASRELTDGGWGFFEIRGEDFEKEDF